MIAQTKTRRRQTDSQTPRTSHAPSKSQPVMRPNVMPDALKSLPANAELHYALGGRSTSHASATQAADRVRSEYWTRSPRSSRGPARVRGIRLLHPSQYLRGDSLVIGTFLACATVVCIVGIAYLAVFANVQYLAHQLRTEQTKLTAATAKKHDLQDQIGRLSSPDLIAAMAPKMDMELPANHAYVDVPATAAPVPVHATVMAAAN